MSLGSRETRKIPLRNHAGDVVAEAVVDVCDAPLAERRWYRLANGYVVRTDVAGGHKRMSYLHRVTTQAPRGVLVDHIDLDRLNNQRSNLRLADYSQNGQNRGANRGRTLPRGVYYRPRLGRFLARIERDPCNSDGFLPLSVREHFDSDVPALLVEIDTLRAVLAEIAAYAEERAAAAEEVGDLFEASLTAIANNARMAIGATR